MITKRNRELHIPVGLPGAGKSTNAPIDCLVVTKDILRQTMLQYKKTNRDFWLDAEVNENGTENLENVVDCTTRQWFLTLLPYGYNIYLDCTNLDCKDRLWYVNAALMNQYTIHYIIYKNHKEAKRRNQERNRVVPQKAIEHMTKSIDLFGSKEIELCESITIVQDNNVMVKIK